MSIEKAELKAAFAHSLGNDFDDELEQAESAVHRSIGAIAAAAKLEASITAVIAKAREEQDGDSPPFRDPEDYTKARTWMNQCLAQVVTFKAQTENARQQHEGRVTALRKVVQRLKKVHDLELAKASALKQSETDGPRQVGQHPGPSVAQQRKAEDAKKKKTKAKKKTAKKATKKKAKKRTTKKR